jgi:hypothetical protein
MRKYLAVPLACVLLAVTVPGAFAHSHRSHKPDHSGPRPGDPRFNPYRYPLCYVWDMRLQRDVWICGRDAY